MKIALIQGGIVSKLITGEVADFPGWIDVTGKYIGEGFIDNGDGTFTDNRVVAPSIIRVITTQAFFRRMTKAERTVLRNSILEPVADLREDLQRSFTVELDAFLEQQLLDTGLLNQSRIDELLVNGTVEEV